MMKIATWNLKRTEGKIHNPARMAKIQEINADLWILTETADAITIPDYHFVASPPSPRKPKQKKGESNVAIWSRWPIVQQLTTYDATEAICVEIAHPDRPILLYGSIIPYHRANHQLGKATWQQHLEAIAGQSADWQQLRIDYPDHLLITGGDYNQARDGIGRYGNQTVRNALSEALAIASLQCVTEQPFNLEKRHNIDHICLDSATADRCTAEVWQCSLKISDHNGTMITIFL